MIGEWNAENSTFTLTSNYNGNSNLTIPVDNILQINFNMSYNNSEGTITNNGTINNNSTINNYGTIINNGTIDNNFGGLIKNHSDGTIANNLERTINNGGTIINDGIICQNI